MEQKDLKIEPRTAEVSDMVDKIAETEATLRAEALAEIRAKKSNGEPIGLEEPTVLDADLSIESAVKDAGLDSKIDSSSETPNILSLHTVPGENTLNLDALQDDKTPGSLKSALMSGTTLERFNGIVLPSSTKSDSSSTEDADPRKMVAGDIGLEEKATTPEPRKMVAGDIGVEEGVFSNKNKLPENMEDNGDGTVTIMYPTVTVTVPIEEALKAAASSTEQANSKPVNKGEENPVSEKSDSPEKTTAPESAPGSEAAAEVAAVAAAIESVQQTGTPVDVEVATDSFALYKQDLEARIRDAKTNFGIPAKQTAGLESELAAHEKKERAFSQTTEALKMVTELLENPELDEKERASLEKRKAILEKISPKIEAKRQDQDRGLLERFGDGFKKNVAERWRNLHWKKKIAFGVGLGLAGSFAGIGTGAAAAVVAAAYSLRSLGAYNMYQGIKAKRVGKMAEELKALEAENEGAVDDEYKKLYIEKALTENTFNKKTALLAGLISFGLPEALKHSGIADAAFEKIGEGAHKVAEALGLSDSALAAKEGAAAAVGAKAESVAQAASNVHVEGGFDHATVQVKAGDNMYKILEREFHISEHLSENGRQYNAIENILTQIKANPAAYGIESGNVNELRVGDTINIAKIGEIVSGTKIGGEGIFEHAKNLPAAVVKSIEDYMPGNAKEAIVDAVASAKTSSVEQVVTTVQPEAPETPNEVGALDADLPTNVPAEAVQPQGAFVPNGGGAAIPQGEFIPNGGGTANVPQGEFIPKVSYEYPPMSAGDSRVVTAALGQRVANNSITMASFVKTGTQDVVSYVANAGPNDSIANMLRSLQTESGLPLRGNVMQYAQNATLAATKAPLGGNTNIA